jgi:hypothetical protein
MKKQTIRTAVSVVALAAAAVAPNGADAKAKRTQRSNDQVELRRDLDSAQEQISELRAEVNALRAKLDQQSTAQSQTASNAQAAETKADQALAQASAATAQAAKPAPVPDSLKWATDTKISGRMYYNISTVSHEVNGSKKGNTDNGVAYNIKRFYLGVDHKFNDVFSANLTTDVSAISGVGQSLYIKKAYLQMKLNPAFIVRLGANDMPWIPYAESIYGYRHIEQTISDRTKFGTSSDWGVHVMGDFADGLVSYQISAVNGAGYRDVHFSKTIDVEGRLSAKYKGFNVGVGGYIGKLGNDIQDANPLRTYHRINALAAYQGNLGSIPVTFGGEYFWSDNKAFNKTAPIASASPGDSGDGFSLFASVVPFSKWSVFGRYDWVKPSKDVNPAFKDTYFNVGVQYSPAKIVDFALVYKHERGVNGAFSAGSIQSGVIGCSTTAANVCVGDGTYDEFGLYGQFRF